MNIDYIKIIKDSYVDNVEIIKENIEEEDFRNNNQTKVLFFNRINLLILSLIDDLKYFKIVYYISESKPLHLKEQKLELDPHEYLNPFRSSKIELAKKDGDLLRLKNKSFLTVINNDEISSLPNNTEVLVFKTNDNSVALYDKTSNVFLNGMFLFNRKG